MFSFPRPRRDTNHRRGNFTIKDFLSSAILYRRAVYWSLSSKLTHNYYFLCLCWQMIEKWILTGKHRPTVVRLWLLVPTNHAASYWLQHGIVFSILHEFRHIKGQRKKHLKKYWITNSMSFWSIQIAPTECCMFCLLILALLFSSYWYWSLPPGKNDRNLKCLSVLLLQVYKW